MLSVGFWPSWKPVARGWVQGLDYLVSLFSGGGGVGGIGGERGFGADLVLVVKGGEVRRDRVGGC